MKTLVSAAVVVVLALPVPSYSDDLHDGSPSLRAMIVDIRNTHMMRYERDQWRKRVAQAQETMDATCHPGILGGAQESALRHWQGCSTLD